MSNNVEDLQKQIAALTARVWRLEQAIKPQTEPVDAVPTPPVTVPVEPAPAQAVNPPAFASTEPAPKEQHTDGSLESRIGSQVFNRVGILAVLIGMAWFLKFAIDNHWIGPAGRVIIGLI